jgi:hypothetical protein
MVAWARGDVAERQLGRFAGGSIDAYDLVDRLPPGGARAAAWAAYAHQTYGDKLVAASRAAGYVRDDTVELACEAFDLAVRCLEMARGHIPAAVLPDTLPRWTATPRFEEQLAGMRDALESLSTYVAFDLLARAEAEAMRSRLAEIEEDMAYARRLWMPRPPVEIAAGIAGALGRGLDRAYVLGCALAAG